ncbi:hypothetical protein FQA39_LY06912 [Lamprigera yunnana]|nr:hypothetical protein FQA39_LY06912 [Lamprigera yunnana]
MSSFINDINKLRSVEQHLENQENALVHGISKSSENTELCNLYKEMQKSRKSQQEELQKSITQILEPLHMMKNSLRSGDLRKIDIKLLRKGLTGMQSSIKNLNESSKASLDALIKQEDTLWEELQTSKHKVEKWEHRIPFAPKPSKTTISIPNNIPREVKEFMDFVALTGGHENGWKIDDHALFLKTRIKFKDIDRTTKVIHALLPDITEDAVIAHEKWYLKYVELKEKQKCAIKDWRANKINSKRSISVNNSPEKVPEKNSHLETVEKEKMREKLLAWKNEKLEQMKFEKEQKQKVIAKQKALEQLRKVRQEDLKVQVNEWKCIQKNVEEEKRIKEEEELQLQRKRALKANKLIKEFQSQDELFIQHKLQLLHSQIKLPQIFSKKNNNIRVDSKFLKPTHQWIMRKYSNNEDIYGNRLNIETVPKL